MGAVEWHTTHTHGLSSVSSTQLGAHPEKARGGTRLTETLDTTKWFAANTKWQNSLPVKEQRKSATSSGRMAHNSYMPAQLEILHVRKPHNDKPGDETI